MKIEEGKFYRTRDDQKVGPMVKYSTRDVFHLPYHKCINNTVTWWGDGCAEYRKSYSDTDLIAEWTDEQDIFTVGEEYTSESGDRWLCIAKSNEFAWLRGAYMDSATAYVWKLNGENVTMRLVPSHGYDIKPGKTITLYGGYDGSFEYFDNAPATTPDKKDTHKLTLPMGEDGPVSGTFTNENGDVIKVERIDG